MNNITANARKLLAQQQHQSFQQRHPQPSLCGTMSTTSTGSAIPVGLKDLIENVYMNTPEEFKHFLELSQDFIQMGSHMMAAAFIAKCNQYMEQAKGAIVHNMSVAGSVVSYDSRSNVVEPWMNRNRTFLNSTNAAPSQIGSTLPTFRRPHPPPSSTVRKHLRPIQENNMPPPQTHSMPRPMKSSSHFLPSSSDDEPALVRGRAPSRMVRSTPIRPEVGRGRGKPRNVNRYDEDNEPFGENISPLRPDHRDDPFRKPTLPPPSRSTSRPRPQASRPRKQTEERGEEEDLFARNSPSTRSNSKKRFENEEGVVKKRPAVDKKKKAAPAQNLSDPLNSTVTRLGRVVKPPKKFVSSSDNSILEDMRAPKALPPPTQEAPKARKQQQPAEEPKHQREENVARKPDSSKKQRPMSEAVVVKKRAPIRDEEEAESSNKRPQSSKADTTVTKRRKLLPTVGDDFETSVYQSKVKQTKPSTSRDTSAVVKTSTVKRAPSAQRKQAAAPKPPTPAKMTPPSPITKKPPPVKPQSGIRKSAGGTPQIEFDISQRSFLSCDNSDSESE